MENKSNQVKIDYRRTKMTETPPVEKGYDRSFEIGSPENILAMPNTHVEWEIYFRKLQEWKEIDSRSITEMTETSPVEKGYARSFDRENFPIFHSERNIQTMASMFPEDERINHDYGY